MTRRVDWRVVVLSIAALLTVGLVVIVLRAPEDRSAFDEFVGDATCLACHQENQSFVGTAHHRTSALATDGTVAGSFVAGENTLRTPNPYLHYRMEARRDGFFQTAVVGVPPDTTTITERFDLVIGSGRKGQTYLYWRGGDRLFQLPVSYWTSLREWISSPGYPEGVVNFERAVAPRCLECHATYFEPLADSGVVNQYHRSRQILGISCEKCHGPGREHVARQRSPIGRYLGTAIVQPAELPRQRQLELCAQCHAGIGEALAPPFSYRPGEPLELYLHLPPARDLAAALEVHGNQLALLERSACFRLSDMTCSTCHDVHRTERDPAALSRRCLSCHQVQQHREVSPGQSSEITTRCVDCHMPELPSNTIVASRDGEPVQPRIRTHWIRVYTASQLR